MAVYLLYIWYLSIYIYQITVQLFAQVGAQLHGANENKEQSQQNREASQHDRRANLARRSGRGGLTKRNHILIRSRTSFALIYTFRYYM